MIDIVIVNWNSGPLLARCVSSIARANVECGLVSQVIVVDNASRDNSTRGLDPCGGRLALVENVHNQGFAAACNKGAALGSARLILFLNPDAEISVKALRVGVEAFDLATRSVPSAVGVQLRSESGALMPSCSRFPSISNLFARATGLDKLWPSLFKPARMVEWNHADTRSVDQVMGAFFLVQRCDFSDAKGFDERFFVYFEEVDYCRRWSYLGRTALFIADASITHHGRGTTKQVPSAALFYSLRSRLQYSRKHLHPTGTWLVVGSAIAVEPLLRASQAAIRFDWKQLATVATAYGHLYRWVLTGQPKRGVLSRRDGGHSQVCKGG